MMKENINSTTTDEQQNINVEQTLNVPKIDISSLISSCTPDSNEINKTIKEIGQACKDWGFFYIIGHRIDPEFILNIQKLSKEFFYKPKEYKQQIERTLSNFRGFTDNELTKQRIDWKEVFDYGPELQNSKDILNNRWPNGMPEFKINMIRYFNEMQHISKKLMCAIFTSLGQNPEEFINDFEENHDVSWVRLNYYPICPKNTNEHLGVGPHTDSEALTILWQDQDVSSLQVKKDHVWYDVYPVPNSFVINIGDMIQVWSNGLYKAPIHRVLAHHHKERFSTPFFYSPSSSSSSPTYIVKPLESCVSKMNPCKYKSINWYDFRKERFAGDYADFGEEIQIAHYEIK